MFDVTREYELVSPDGARESVVLRVYNCRAMDVDWGADFSIEGLTGYDRARTVYGVDPIQCVLNALHVARAVLSVPRPPEQGHLEWLGAPIDADAGIRL
ncbi:MAG: hypothetical protein M3Y87_07205 [Myxococcota bacterium]|nr:hypothetical protein [Myxococcota bacterium]